MIYLIAAFIFFLCFVGSHILGYRLKVVRFQGPLFAALYFFWFLVFATIIYARAPANLSGWLFILNYPFKFSSLVLYSLLCLWYICQCIVVQHASPSLTIVQAINHSPKKGLSRSDLKKLFSDEQLIANRLTDLVKHGHANFDGAYYLISKKGLLIAKLLAGYRKTLNRGLGG